MSKNSKSKFSDNSLTLEDDLGYLREWSSNIRKYLDEHDFPKSWGWEVLKPNKIEASALLRLSINNQYVINQLQSYIDYVNDLHIKFIKDTFGENKQAPEDLYNAMSGLADWIDTTIETIESNDTRGTEKDIQKKSLPKKAEFLKLIHKINSDLPEVVPII